LKLPHLLECNCTDYLYIRGHNVHCRLAFSVVGQRSCTNSVFINTDNPSVPNQYSYLTGAIIAVLKTDARKRLEASGRLLLAFARQQVTRIKLKLTQTHKHARTHAHSAWTAHDQSTYALRMKEREREKERERFNCSQCTRSVKIYSDIEREREREREREIRQHTMHMLSRHILRPWNEKNRTVCVERTAIPSCRVRLHRHGKTSAEGCAPCGQTRTAFVSGVNFNGELGLGEEHLTLSNPTKQENAQPPYSLSLSLTHTRTHAQTHSPTLN
jgi:hypothetical protein